MNHKIHESLIALALPLDDLVPLPGNPRVGNVDAIAASYDEFGQLKPVVVKANEDNTYTIMAGNHQVQAARRLGWTHIAAVQMDDDDERAVAFALVDNRVSDLGKTDQVALREMLGEVVEIYPELFDAVGWDDFEIALLEDTVDHFSEVGTGAGSGYVPPVLLTQPGAPLPTTPMTTGPSINPRIELTDDDDEDDEGARFVAPVGVDQRTAAIGGSPITGTAGTRKTSFQYTMVFDDADQMKRWWDFVRWLRGNAGYEGETIAAKFMSFIDAHSEI